MVNPLDGTSGVNGHRVADPSLLDDEAKMLGNDPGGMLRATCVGPVAKRTMWGSTMSCRCP